MSVARYPVRIEPMVEELPGALSAWEIARHLASKPHLVFLDSARGQGYSYIAADPVRFHCLPVGNCFDLVDSLLAQATAPRLPDLPPFQGGLLGLFGYGLGHEIERLPASRIDEFQVPELAVGLYDWVIACDHQQRRQWLISTGFPEPDPNARRLRAQQRIEQVTRWLREDPLPPIAPPASRVPILSRQEPLPGYPQVTSNFDRDGYQEAVRRAIDYVHAGDCFQVNLSQRLLTPARCGSLDLYGRLRDRNPAPMAGYFDLGDYQILSASPERFLRVQDRLVETRPIKGTRPRGANAVEDAAIMAELSGSSKDRAENVMIVDLLRNDLGRVCDYGTVRVPVVCQVESYAYVHHLVSEVRGRLSAGKSVVDLLRASFPGGSVTGAPKVRAMEIIAELEPTARGPYCGSLGYIGFNGCADTSILIRTITAGRGWWQFPVGGGIVADSDPVREYEETLHKAHGLLRALPEREGL